MEERQPNDLDGGPAAAGCKSNVREDGSACFAVPGVNSGSGQSG